MKQKLFIESFFSDLIDILSKIFLLDKYILDIIFPSIILSIDI